MRILFISRNLKNGLGKEGGIFGKWNFLVEDYKFFTVKEKRERYLERKNIFLRRKRKTKKLKEENIWRKNMYFCGGEGKGEKYLEMEIYILPSSIFCIYISFLIFVIFVIFAIFVIFGIHHHTWDSGLHKKYSTLLLFQLFSWRHWLFHGICNCLCICISISVRIWIGDVTSFKKMYGLRVPEAWMWEIGLWERKLLTDGGEKEEEGKYQIGWYPMGPTKKSFLAIA